MNFVRIIQKTIFYMKYVFQKILINSLKLLWIFPVNENDILFLSFDGKQYSDNPKYISEELSKKYKSKNIYWAFTDINKYLFLQEMGYKLIRRNSWRFFIAVTSTKLVITNNFIPTYIPIRKKQIVLNTWHGGSPLKTVGLAENNKSEYSNYYFKLQEKKYTAFLSSSKFMTEEVFHRSFAYNGLILPFGMPRNSILLSENNAIKEKVYKYFEIPLLEDMAVVLYAPTFRGDFNNASFLDEDELFEIERCIKILNKKFNKNFTFLVRAHHTMNSINLRGNYMNATSYPDMQELLFASDVLITDYSSCMGDMALMHKPVFLYTPDLEIYTKERGFYWDISTLPFPIARNKEDIYVKIFNFNKEKYKVDVDSYLDKLGSYEGKASLEKTVSWLASKIIQGE